MIQVILLLDGLGAARWVRLRTEKDLPAPAVVPPQAIPDLGLIG
jgi:hypothetical protein